MRCTGRLLVVLAAVPVALAAQVASTARVYIPDLSWVGPVVASATARAHTAIVATGPALARMHGDLIRAQVALENVGPAMASIRPALAGIGPALAHVGPALAAAFDWDDWDAADFVQTPPEAWAQTDPADQLYRDARSALNRQRYTSAADLFGQIYTKYPRSSYAGDAYYWQAYALSHRDNDESLKRALDILARQKEKAPRASTRGDADVLATRIRGRLAKSGDAPSAEEITSVAITAGPPIPPGGGIASAAPGTPSAPVVVTTLRPGRSRSKDKCGGDDDVQTAALNALQQMDSEKALPILRRVLARRDEGSECLRRKAVFIVSQQNGREAEQILLDAARSDPDSEVREQAVWWLSQVNSPSAVAALDSILRSATDPVLQGKAIFALSQQESPKARQALRDFALRSSASDELRENAIFWIGQGNDPDRMGFLKTLYGQLKAENLRDKILFSISQIEGRESSEWLLGVASDVNENIELRKKALFWVGQSNYPMSELATLYDRMPSREMKEQLIFVYSQRSEKSAVDRLMQIARTEKDAELQKKAIFWLGQSNDPRVPEFIASLLENPRKP